MPLVTSSSAPSKLPQLVFETTEPAVYAFAPNRETLGGTAYLIAAPNGGILVDTPAWSDENQQFLAENPVKWLILTHRGGIGKNLVALQQRLQCQVLIQEQEAYLIPEVESCTFQHSYMLSETLEMLWTPGHSPGSSCLYTTFHGGTLFSGRHLLPDRHGHPQPLRTAKTFHWPRQLNSVAALRDRFNPETLQYICPGASIGLLRGTYAMTEAYQKLMAIKLGDDA